MKRILTIVTVALVLAPAAAFAAGGQFTDDDNSIFESNIEWLAGAGVTAGCNPPTNDNFCPDDNVSRGQMAAFMQRFAQFLGAEDGTVSTADSAATAASAATADSATNAANADLLGGLSAEDLIDSSPLVVAAADFNPDGGGAHGDHYLSWSASGWRQDVNSGQCLQAPVPLPNGAELVSVDIVSLDTAGNGFYAFHTAPLGDSASEVEVVGASVASGMTQIVSVDVSAITASNANQNWIGVCLRSVGDILYGATVSYTITDASIASVPAQIKLGSPSSTDSTNGS